MCVVLSHELKSRKKQKRDSKLNTSSPVSRVNESSGVMLLLLHLQLLLSTCLPHHDGQVPSKDEPTPP